MLKKVYKLQEEIIYKLSLPKQDVAFVDIKNGILSALNDKNKNQEMVSRNINESIINDDLNEIKTSKLSSISQQLESVMNMIEKQGQQQNRLQERLENLENNSNIIKNRIKKYSYIIFFSYFIYTIINYSKRFFN